MATFRPSPLIAEISGSVGGVTFLSGAGPGVIQLRGRQRRRHQRPGLEPRAITGDLNNAWAGLTVAQRDGWQAAAKSLDLKRSTARKGKFSGRMYFIRFNWWRYAILGLVAGDPPSFDSVARLETLQVTASEATTIDVTFSVTPGLPVTNFVWFGQRTVCPASRRTFRNMRALTVTPSSPTSITLGFPFRAALGQWQAGERIRIVGQPQFPTLGVYQRTTAETIVTP